MRCSRLARLLVAVLILTTVLGSSGIALGQRITAANNDLSITVYNQGLGLVKEIRRIHVDSGITNVTVSDVAAQLDPTSVHFRSLSNASTQVLEQNFEYDLVNQSRLLERYLGQEIELIDDNNTSRRVTLLAHQGQFGGNGGRSHCHRSSRADSLAKAARWTDHPSHADVAGEQPDCGTPTG